MRKNKNPFVFGKIVGDENFCNRAHEIKELQQNINNTYSVWLFAPRRYGKSSLVKQVFKQTKNVKTIYFDFYNIESVDDFSRRYSDLLSKELFNWKDEIKTISENVKHYFSSLSPKISFTDDGIPELTLAQQQLNKQNDITTILNIPEKIAKSSNINICIAFDEFQEISRIDKFIVNWMRSEFQNQEKVSYIFLGSKQSLMENIFTNINSPFYEYAVKMDIKPIDRRELYNYLHNKFENNSIIVNDEIINEILNKSRCHPHFTQHFASVIYDIKSLDVDISNEDLKMQWMAKIINSQSLIFQNIYDGLSNNQRKVLWLIAKQVEEIYSNYTRNKYNLPATSSITASITALLKKNLIEINNNAYIISNPVLKEWLLGL